MQPSTDQWVGGDSFVGSLKLLWAVEVDPTVCSSVSLRCLAVTLNAKKMGAKLLRAEKWVSLESLFFLMAVTGPGRSNVRQGRFKGLSCGDSSRRSCAWGKGRWIFLSRGHPSWCISLSHALTPKSSTSSQNIITSLGPSIHNTSLRGDISDSNHSINPGPHLLDSWELPWPIKCGLCLRVLP